MTNLSLPNDMINGFEYTNQTSLLVFNIVSSVFFIHPTISFEEGLRKLV